jgi:flagellar P-ring protein precursor FlgI
LASGPLQLEDEENPTVARIAGGAILERDWIHNYIALGRELSAYRSRSSVRPLDWIRADEPYVTFVVDQPHAEWAMSYTIAQAINEEASISELASGDTDAQIAMAFDPRTIIVRVPASERLNPAPFIARLERLQLFMPFTEARVTIRRKSGLIAITGDAEISPTIISYKGLTINTTIPQPAEKDTTPKTVESNWVPMDPQNKGGARLTDLIEALRQLRVPEQDRITIVEQLHQTGRLHATLKVED